jgi:DNA repair exonuclease SbcCD ATPase subunit
MRPVSLVVSVAAFLLMAGPAWSRQDQPPKRAQDQEQSTAAQSHPKAQAQTPAQEDTLAEAARKAREERKEGPKATHVFTNDNIPTAGGISSVGATPTTPASNGTGASPSKTAGKAPANDERTWRARFATLRHKLEQDQAELSIMERELGQLNLQYYPDPNKQMQQQFSREDINKKTAAIEEKKKQIAADQQAISDAEDALRRAGGDPGWEQ